MSSKMIFSFISGLVVGGGLGFIAASKSLDKKYFEKYDKKAKELEEYYGKNGVYDRRKTDLEDGNDIQSERENGPLTLDQRNDIKNKLLQNEKQTTNYASMYRSKAGPMADSLENKLAEEESPSEDTGDEAQTEDEAAYERAFDEHQANKNREPRLISAEASEGLGPEWERQTLLFYIYNDALTTEDDDLVYDQESLVGDCLYKYGFDSNDEMVIYVQNFALTTVYEVQKVMAAFN